MGWVGLGGKMWGRDLEMALMTDSVGDLVCMDFDGKGWFGFVIYGCGVRLLHGRLGVGHEGWFWWGWGVWRRRTFLFFILVFISLFYFRKCKFTILLFT